MKLHTKIFILLFTTLAGLGSASMLFLYQSVKENVEEDSSERLQVAQRTFYDVLDNQKNLLNASVETVVKDWALRQAIGQEDYTTLQSVLRNHSNRVGADVAVFIDLDGEVNASTKGVSSKLNDTASSLINTADQKTFQRIAAIGNNFYQLVLTEVRAPVHVGWVGMGFVIDDAFAQRYSKITGVDISFILNEASDTPSHLTFVASTLRDERLNHLKSTPIILQATHWPINAKKWQDLALYRSFDETNNSKLGVLLQRSLNEPREKFNQWWLSLLSIFGLISAVALAVGYALSRGITKPLDQLLIVIDDVSKGNYSSLIKTTRKDEIGSLSKSFAAMQQAVSLREEEINYRASHNTLTGLLNRNGFLEHCTSIITALDQPKEILILATFRLNHFQEIIDALGHSWGDELLKLVTARLENQLNVDCAAHLNLDEFVVAYVASDIGQARKFSEALHNEFTQDFHVSDICLSLQATVGVAIYPFSADTPEGLLRRAGVALNEAIKARCKTVIYDPKHDENSVRRLTLMSELPNAIRENQTRLFFQPKLARRDDKVVVESVECLVRWIHPELGFVPPDDFIELAEKTGYIVELTQWVLRRAMEQCLLWRTQGLDIAVAVNISAMDLQQKNFAQSVSDMLDEHKLPAKSLTLEITESAAVQDPESAIEHLSRLKQLGIKLSIDDYGTGYSSLVQLKQLPVHELKVDKSFILNLKDDNEDQIIVRSTIELSHNIGLSVVAEGVEDESGMQQLLEWKCDYLQGFHIAKPMDNEGVAQWLSTTHYPIRPLDQPSPSIISEAKSRCD